MEWRCHVWGARHEGILKQSSGTGEDMGQFFARPINKAVPSFTNSLISVHVRER